MVAYQNEEYINKRVRMAYRRSKGLALVFICFLLVYHQHFIQHFICFIRISSVDQGGSDSGSCLLRLLVCSMMPEQCQHGAFVVLQWCLWVATVAQCCPLLFTVTRCFWLLLSEFSPLLPVGCLRFACGSPTGGLWVMGLVSHCCLWIVH